MNTPDPKIHPPTQPPADLKHQDELLDEALAETFPASDPPSSLHTDEPLTGQAGSRRNDGDKARSKAPK
jgi:hypothetical protein